VVLLLPQGTYWGIFLFTPKYNAQCPSLLADEYAVRAMRTNYKLRSDGGNSLICRLGYGSHYYDGAWRCLRLAGV
jgi:hypothetical protein